ncbi:MAG: hypothetical protein J2P45_17940 [Candidatus Dormibacteraeota bacterium]|nr:hypothetical protein [Candidatus Dormibacteraeota bacterium]
MAGSAQPVLDRSRVVSYCRGRRMVPGESNRQIHHEGQFDAVGEPLFSVQEVRQLWAFLDGAIMAVDTRHRLWRSWGLCPRHAWGYAIAEIELRGGRPFSTTILYEDLVGRARRLLERTRLLPWSVVVTRFRPRGECSTCDFLAIDPRFVEDHAQAMTAEVNRLERTRELLSASRPIWMESSCPHCLGGGGPVCLRHLLSGQDPGQDPGEDRQGLIEQVGDLDRRLRAFGKSMTWKGGPATHSEQASWIEALGWLADWRFPLLVLGESPSVGGPAR